MQTKHGWDKVIRGFLTHVWQFEFAQISETINNNDTLSTFIISIWDTWEEAWQRRNADFNSKDRYEY
jgi:hypothetical protein